MTIDSDLYLQLQSLPAEVLALWGEIQDDNLAVPAEIRPQILDALDAPFVSSVLVGAVSDLESRIRKATKLARDGEFNELADRIDRIRPLSGGAKRFASSDCVKIARLKPESPLAAFFPSREVAIAEIVPITTERGLPTYALVLDPSALTAVQARRLAEYLAGQWGFACPSIDYALDRIREGLTLSSSYFDSIVSSDPLEEELANGLIFGDTAALNALKAKFKEAA